MFKWIKRLINKYRLYQEKRQESKEFCDYLDSQIQQALNELIHQAKLDMIANKDKIDAITQRIKTYKEIHNVQK